MYEGVRFIHLYQDLDQQKRSIQQGNVHKDKLIQNAVKALNQNVKLEKLETLLEHLAGIEWNPTNYHPILIGAGIVVELLTGQNPPLSIHWEEMRSRIEEIRSGGLPFLQEIFDESKQQTVRDQFNFNMAFIYDEYFSQLSPHNVKAKSHFMLGARVAAFVLQDSFPATKAVPPRRLLNQ